MPELGQRYPSPMQNQTSQPPGYGLLYIAMAFGTVAFLFGVVPTFSLAVRLWVTIGGDVLMVATLVVWVIVGRRAPRG